MDYILGDDFSSNAEPQEKSPEKASKSYAPYQDMVIPSAEAKD